MTRKIRDNKQDKTVFTKEGANVTENNETAKLDKSWKYGKFQKYTSLIIKVRLSSNACVTSGFTVDLSSILLDRYDDTLHKDAAEKVGNQQSRMITRSTLMSSCSARLIANSINAHTVEFLEFQVITFLTNEILRKFCYLTYNKKIFTIHV